MYVFGSLPYSSVIFLRAQGRRAATSLGIPRWTALHCSLFDPCSHALDVLRHVLLARHERYQTCSQRSGCTLGEHRAPRTGHGRQPPATRSSPGRSMISRLGVLAELHCRMSLWPTTLLPVPATAIVASCQQGCVCCCLPAAQPFLSCSALGDCDLWSSRTEALLPAGAGSQACACSVLTWMACSTRACDGGHSSSRVCRSHTYHLQRSKEWPSKLAGLHLRQHSPRGTRDKLSAPALALPFRRRRLRGVPLGHKEPCQRQLACNVCIRRGAVAGNCGLGRPLKLSLCT
jgi:hypothetical protein